jgi:hypothetical protein
MIRSNQIKDCPVTVQDVDVAIMIWGPNVAALKKTTGARQFRWLGLRENSQGVLNLHKEVF